MISGDSEQPLEGGLGFCFLSMLEAKPFKEMLVQSVLGTHQPAEVCQVVTFLANEFHLFARKWFSRKSEMEVCADRTQDTEILRELVQILLQSHGGFHGAQSFTALI